MRYKGNGTEPKSWSKLITMRCGAHGDGEETYYWDKEEKIVVRIKDEVVPFPDGVYTHSQEIHKEEEFKLDYLVYLNKEGILKELKKHRYISNEDINKARIKIKEKEQNYKEKELSSLPLKSILKKYGWKDMLNTAKKRMAKNVLIFFA